VKADHTDFDERYRATLHDFLAPESREHAEGALLRAYDCGRQALTLGLGVLDLVAIHQDAMLAFAPGPLRADEVQRLSELGEEFVT
jgi:hypothetical protein